MAFTTTTVSSTAGADAFVVAVSWAKAGLNMAESTRTDALYPNMWARGAFRARGLIPGMGLFIFTILLPVNMWPDNAVAIIASANLIALSLTIHLDLYIDAVNSVKT
jgi:hypothetical protein